VHEAAIRDGDAVGVVAEVPKDLRRAAERALGIDDPALGIEALPAPARGAIIGLAGVLSIVRRQAAERAGTPFDEAEDATIRQMVQSQIEKESYAFFATARVWDDGIIDPRDTRTILGLCLSVVRNGPVKGADGYGVFRL